MFRKQKGMILLPTLRVGGNGTGGSVLPRLPEKRQEEGHGCLLRVGGNGSVLLKLPEKGKEEAHG